MQLWNGGDSSGVVQTRSSARELVHLRCESADVLELILGELRELAWRGKLSCNLKRREVAAHAPEHLLQLAQDACTALVSRVAEQPVHELRRPHSLVGRQRILLAVHQQFSEIQQLRELLLLQQLEL